MIRVLPLLVLLAACGVDGAPIPPSEAEAREAAKTGVTASGSLEVGVTGSF